MGPSPELATIMMKMDTKRRAQAQRLRARGRGHFVLWRWMERQWEREGAAC